jgi:hypothetical protein
MRKILLAFLSVTLIAAIAFGANDRRAEKLAEEREIAKELSAVQLASLQQNSISPYWDTLSINTAGIVFHTVKALPGNVLWVVGYYSAAPQYNVTFRSTDNGATWKKDTLKAAGTDGVIFAPKNADVAIAASFTGYVYRTTNGGTSWDSVWYYGAGNGYFDGAMFKGTSDSVIAYGDADASGLCVIRSLDAGATWTRMANLPAEEMTAGKWIASAAYRHSMDIIDNDVWLSTYTGSGTYGRIVRSTDFGDSWTSSAATLTPGASQAYTVRALNMYDKNVGWLIPRQSGSSSLRSFAHKTTDGGLTWSDTMVTVRGMVLKGLRQAPQSNIVLATGYVGSVPKAALSGDGGKTWAAIHPDSAADGSDLGMIDFTSTNNGYSAGYYRAMKFKVSTVTFQAKMNIKMREGGFQPGSGDVVQVKGSINGWGGNDIMSDPDGDSTYAVTVPAAEGAIEYKFFKTLRAGLDWEGVANRAYTVVAGAQTIPAVYFDNDSVYTPPVPQGVTFRVNMKIKMLEQTFLPGSGDIVRVAGSFNNWGSSTDTLTDADHDSIFTKTITLNENQAIEYKFLKTARSGDWESVDNRKFTVPVGGGAIPVAFFDNDSLFNAPVTVNFLWQVKMTPYQTLGWFRPDLKDSLEVRGGFNGWGGTKLLPVTGQPGSYEAAIVYNGTIGDALNFKYFMALDSAGATARFPGYIHSGTGATRDGFCYDHPAERGDGNRLFNVTGGGNVPVPQVYFSNIDPRGLMANATDTCRVTLKVNMGPAKRYVDAFVPAADTVRLIWQDALWRGGQRLARAGGQFPDITMTPAAGGGDSIYQATFTVMGKTHYNMQYTYRYIHAGGNAVDQGGGLGGQNPYITRFIAPLGANTWPATYAAPTDLWKRDAPLVGENPPFTTAVEPEPGNVLPTEFALLQNYPNPFNPTTNIRYALPAQANVTLKVFNVVGQEVATLINGVVQNRGTHIATFDASNMATGVYFYRLEAGKFLEVKKMLLLK